MRENPSQSNTPELVIDAQKGDLEAYNKLVIEFQDQIFNYIYRMLGDDESAEDVTQDVFLIAYLNLAKYRNGSFRSWLYRIATNACYDLLRRRKRHPAISIEYENDVDENNRLSLYMTDHFNQPEYRYEQSEFERTIQIALTKLDVNHRAVVELIDLMEFDYMEVAKIMGIPIGTVKSRLYRARSQLRMLLQTNNAVLPEQRELMVFQQM